MVDGVVAGFGGGAGAGTAGAGAAVVPPPGPLAQVEGPTMPSAVRPLRRWNVRTARAVRGPKMPSALTMRPLLMRKVWNCRTSSPTFRRPSRRPGKGTASAAGAAGWTMTMGAATAAAVVVAALAGWAPPKNPAARPPPSPARPTRAAPRRLRGATNDASWWWPARAASGEPQGRVVMRPGPYSHRRRDQVIPSDA